MDANQLNHDEIVDGISEAVGTVSEYREDDDQYEDGFGPDSNEKVSGLEDEVDETADEVEGDESQPTEHRIQTVVTITRQVKLTVSKNKDVAASKKCVWSKKYHEGTMSLSDILVRWDADPVLQAYWPDPENDLVNGVKTVRKPKNPISIDSVRADTDRIRISQLETQVIELTGRLIALETLVAEMPKPKAKKVKDAVIDENVTE